MLHSPISFSLVMRVEMLNHPGGFGILTEAIHDAGGTISALDMHSATKEHIVRDVTISVPSDDVAARVRAAIEAIEGARIIFASDETFLAHLGGKIHVEPKIPVKNRQDLSTIYAPGVARVSMAIAADPHTAFKLTIKRNTVAVVTDGTAVLGLGDIGPLGALPVMEGKAMLFRQFGEIDAFPICLDTQDVNEIVETVVRIAPVFGGINLEDISAPRCFEIEERLIEALDIPVMHDEQHGTAVVVLAALMNAAKVVGKQMEDLHIVISGSATAANATIKMLLDAGVRDVVPVDRTGALGDVLGGADAFIGLSGSGNLRPGDVSQMAREPIVFAMANPVAEIIADAGSPFAAVVATGRSDFPNQINTLLAFPGIFRGALNARARRITEGMKHAAARAIAEMVGDDERCAQYVIPSILDPRVCNAVAKAVAAAAVGDGVARKA